MLYTCILDVFKSIPINVEYSKVIVDLINIVVFHLMTSP